MSKPTEHDYQPTKSLSIYNDRNSLVPHHGRSSLPFRILSSPLFTTTTKDIVEILHLAACSSLIPHRIYRFSDPTPRAVETHMQRSGPLSSPKTHSYLHQPTHILDVMQESTDTVSFSSIVELSLRLIQQTPAPA